MIDHYKLNLNYSNENGFKGNPGYRIYGCLMERLPYDLGERMHENAKTPISQNIEYNNKKGEAHWCVSSFDEELSAELDDLFKEGGEFSIEQDGIVLRTESVERTHINGFSDIRKLSESISDSYSMTLHFRTTTALKKNGMFVPYPELELLIDNLWNQWNVVFPDNSFDDDEVLKLIKLQTSVGGYNLSSSKYRMKGATISGFYGRLTINNRLSAPLRELLAALFTFAEFNGIGVKNALGMGKTVISDNTLLT